MDKDQVDELIALGTNPESITRVQNLARQLMKETGNGYTLRLACAATLSCFLTEAGIPIAKTVGAGELARRLRMKRNWKRVEVGDQRAGDVGVTFDKDPNRPGADHVYLVVERVDRDLMFIADNQVEGKRHHRTASGKKTGRMSSAKTATEYFLRAPESVALALEAMASLDDENTNALREPFNDEGILVGFGSQ
ncbi:hypothetical protein [Novosphingobium guangzhouense]|uniref:Uncharacterized protein n=1 Tax=Novosphingobium guangzhouense TaxID=1850347 RepID=A0A2K2G0M4_9SPHN|nr:hypothetical protein [Novosphingobium guangzhouense]PNU04552.1 hypothetical protein A8V01_19250 [Novosphingobium guangzhouense]